MNVLTLHELYFLGLTQRLEEGRLDYVSKAKAYEMLKQLTGQDFGDDAFRWGEWLQEHGLIRPERSQVLATAMTMRKQG